MHPTRICVVLLLLAAVIGSGKSPANTNTATSTVCDRYQSSDLIFTGSTETTWITMVDTLKSPVHKRSEKGKRVRFLVREWYKGARQSTVAVWITPGECPLRVEANQNYLIYAHINKDKGRIEANPCTSVMPVDSASSDLRYLIAAQLGPANATRVSGNAGGPNLNVTAKSGIDTRYAVSDAAGLFTFDGLSAGDWAVSVPGGAAKNVHLEPNTCVEVK